MKRMSTRIAAVTVAAALGLGGCGKDQPPVCDSLAAAQTTMVQIRNANVSENGLGPLKTSLQELKGDIDVLITDAKTQFASEAQGVRGAADQVSASVAAARETPDLAHLSQVRTSLGVLRSSLQVLGDAMSGTC
jgi:ABC-type glycerol-3-phosphate transport system substrate-binding protein